MNPPDSFLMSLAPIPMPAARKRSQTATAGSQHPRRQRVDRAHGSAPSSMIGFEHVWFGGHSFSPSLSRVAQFHLGHRRFSCKKAFASDFFCGVSEHAASMRIQVVIATWPHKEAWHEGERPTGRPRSTRRTMSRESMLEPDRSSQGIAHQSARIEHRNKLRTPPSHQYQVPQIIGHISSDATFREPPLR